MWDFIQAGFLQWSWWQMILLGLVVTQMTIVSTTLYLHRSATHRAVDFHPALNHAFRFWLWLATATVTKQWVAIHRKHHAKCETSEDPHSPKIFGINTVLWKGAELYQAVQHDQVLLDQYGKGTPDDWLERHVYTPHSYAGIFLLLIIQVGCFGLMGLALWAIQMAWIPFWAAGVINGLGHFWGYRNFDTHDASTNLTPWALWVGGEELHNNHHANPSSARFSVKPFEVDIGWTWISMLRSLHLCKVLRVPPALSVRSDVAHPDDETMRAIMAHRWHTLTDYFNSVLTPQVAASLPPMPRRFRKALRSDGRWLDEKTKMQLNAWVSQCPKVSAMLAYRAELSAIFDLKSAQLTAKKDALAAWCHSVENAGIPSLRDFSIRLKGYTISAPSLQTG